jgi:hypothetical protein
LDLLTPVTAILITFYPFFSESPYYLLKKGQRAEARKSLSRIHGPGDQSLIDAEMMRIENAMIASEERKKAARHDGLTFLQCFQGSNLVCWHVIVHPWMVV